MNGQYEETKEKLEKLDNAFLFVISIVGLLFTVVQVYSEGITGLVQISPLLFLGVVLPFYVGYIRGAIEYNSLVERIRGWVYLAVGVSGFLAVTMPSFDPTGLFGFLVYFLLVSLSAFSAYYLEKWFKSTLGLQEEISNLSAISGTMVSSFLLAFLARFLMIIVGEITAKAQYTFSLLLNLLAVYLSLLVFLRLEKILRQIIRGNTAIVNLIKEQNEQAFAKQQKGSFFLLITMYLPFSIFLCSLLPIGRKIGVFWGMGWASLLAGSFLSSSQTYSVLIIPDVLFLMSMLFFTVESISFLRTKEIKFPTPRNSARVQT